MLCETLNSLLNTCCVDIDTNTATNTLPPPTFWEKIGVDKSSLCAIGSGILIMNGITSGFLAQKLVAGVEIIHLNGLNPNTARKLTISLALTIMIVEVSFGLFLAKRSIVEQPEKILSNIQIMGFSASIKGLVQFLS